MVPSRKVAIGAFAGAIVGVLVWGAKAFGGVEIPGDVAVYLSTILVGVTQYYVPEAE